MNGSNLAADRELQSARQFTHATSAALLLTAIAANGIYLRWVVPTLASNATRFNEALPLIVRIQIYLGGASLWLAPEGVVCAVAAYFAAARGRIVIPEVVKSGRLLAGASTVALAFTVVCLLAALFQATRLMQ
jgi:hypothetical protein